MPSSGCSTTPWSLWSQCNSVTGTQVRSRRISAVMYGPPCNKILTQYQDCSVYVNQYDYGHVHIPPHNDANQHHRSAPDCGGRVGDGFFSSVRYIACAALRI